MEDSAKKPATADTPPEQPAKQGTHKPLTPVPAEPDPQELARTRAAHCGQEVEAILAKHRCRIVPFLNHPERVGEDGAKLIVSASFGIQPLA